MKEYTKAERLEIYKKARHLFDNPCTDEYIIVGICHALSVAIGFNFDFQNTWYRFRKTFPEIYSLKPRRIILGDYWWPENDREIRKQKLTEIIKRMEAEL